MIYMKLLMHMCCAPCSTYPVMKLNEDKINVTGFFYNPNIHPLEEYQKRKDMVQKYASIKKLEVIYIDDYMEDEWLCYNNCDNKRCNMCYRLRINKTAAYAKENGFNAFSTTLLISPYQNHELIKKLGEEYGLKYGIKFYYQDFRKHFREGQAIAKELNLYRQKYCGCIISFNEVNSKRERVKIGQQ